MLDDLDESSLRLMGVSDDDDVARIHNHSQIISQRKSEVEQRKKDILKEIRGVGRDSERAAVAKRFITHFLHEDSNIKAGSRSNSPLPDCDVAPTEPSCCQTGLRSRSFQKPSVHSRLLLNDTIAQGRCHHQGQTEDSYLPSTAKVKIPVSDEQRSSNDWIMKNRRKRFSSQNNDFKNKKLKTTVVNQQCCSMRTEGILSPDAVKCKHSVMDRLGST